MNADEFARRLRDPETEDRVVGTALQFGERFGLFDAAGFTSGDFASRHTRAVWDACSALWADGVRPDALTALTWLDDAKRAGDVERVWLFRVGDGCTRPQPELLARWRDRLRTLAEARTVAASARAVLDGLAADPLDVATVTAAHRHTLDALGAARDLDDAPLLDDASVLAQPGVSWLVPFVLAEHGFGVLAGEPGAGKTFAALGLGLSIASGKPWLGFRVAQRGPVLYSLAEGVAGRGDRVRAWKARHGLALDTVAGVHFYDRAFTLADPVAVQRFLRRARPLAPVLVVLDTFARHFGGDNENDAAQVGAFVATCDRVRDTLGCAVLVVHHVGVNGDRERGSTALRGAADVLVLLRAGDADLTLECAKAKDAEPFPTVAARLEPVGDSLVCVPAYEAAPTTGDLTHRQTQVLDTLRRKFTPTRGATLAELVEIAGLPKTTVFEAVTVLARRGLLAEHRGRYRLSLAAQEAAA